MEHWNVGVRHALNPGSNRGLPHCRLILYQLSHKGSPGFTWNNGMWENAIFLCGCAVISNNIIFVDQEKAVIFSKYFKTESSGE